MDDLADLGVRRVSTGGALAFAAYGALVKAGRGQLEGDTGYLSRGLGEAARREALDA